MKKRPETNYRKRSVTPLKTNQPKDKTTLNQSPSPIRNKTPIKNKSVTPVRTQKTPNKNRRDIPVFRLTENDDVDQLSMSRVNVIKVANTEVWKLSGFQKCLENTYDHLKEFV